MSDLTTLLNNGREQVPTRIVNPFNVKMGSIPYVVPVLRDDGRAFAGGKIVLAERLGALRSGDNQQIEAWGNNYYDLADACITFEDLLKVQPDSPLLKGIRGVLETSDGRYVAVDAEAVSKATNNDMRYFTVMHSENVTYGIGDNKVSKQASNVVLLKYARPSHVELSADQFNSVDAKALKRGEFINGRDMSKDEIVKAGKVVHPVYKILYSDELVNPLVNETFKCNGKEYGYDTNMGLFLPSETKGHAELRALCANGLGDRSRLYGNGSIGNNYCCRLVGVVESGAEGAVKK